ncbi:hypothetical protein [Soonwooa sp.]|uniref:hypothetical protein n=1 Tax=Soonwooa sp. TaxID=1938592 RepID=UPI00289B72ED|nr:hypothetical protein [Soonwooa sp.]
MNFNKIFFIISLIFSTTFLNQTKAQTTTHWLLNTGYAYQTQSFGEIGVKALFLKNDDVLYRLGGSALLGNANGKFAAIPKLQGDVLLNFQKGVDLYHSHYFILGAEATTKYIAPKVGVSILGIIDLTAGYGFGFSGQNINGKELKGLNINFGLNLPFVMLNDMLK